MVYIRMLHSVFFLATTAVEKCRYLKQSSPQWILFENKANTQSLAQNYILLFFSPVEEKVVVDYWENITLHCPAEGVMNIVRAEYVGRSCASKNIHCAVSLFCKKESNCVLKNSNYTAVKCDRERSKIRVRYTCT